MSLKKRSMLALGLVALGALGLVLAAPGGLPGAPAWCWLAVLALGVSAHVATEAARQKQRLSARHRRQLASLEAAVMRTAERLDQVGTPEGMKAFRETVQKMANDLKPIAEAFNSGQLAANLAKRMGGRQ
jgi:hypothetical protein